MVDTDDTRRTTEDGRRTTPRVWHKLPTGELTTHFSHFSWFTSLSALPSVYQFISCHTLGSTALALVCVRGHFRVLENEKFSTPCQGEPLPHHPQLGPPPLLNMQASYFSYFSAMYPTLSYFSYF